jgi:putative transcriptional regulator
LTSTDQPREQDILAPAHHPAAELLIDYTSGANSPAETLLIELHLTFCAGCRRSVEVLLAAAGDLFNGLPPALLAPNMFNQTLRLLDQAPVQKPLGRPAQPALPLFAKTWPHVLRRQVQRHNLRKWRHMPAGFRAMRVPFADPSSRIWVMKAPEGRGPFPHSHLRDEWTVVLEGGFSDETGTYNAGDFAYAGPGESHTVIAEPGDGCVCVLLVRAPPVYTTWPGKLLAPFISI